MNEPKEPKPSFADDTATSSSFQPTTEQSTFRFTNLNPNPNPRPNASPSPPAPSFEEVDDEYITHLKTASSPPTPPPSDPRSSPPTSSHSHSDDDDANPTDARTCRICFDISLPPHDPSPELGHLISPCSCTGSGRYVHSGCLQQWRKTSKKAYYECPTCKYQYRLRRLTMSAFLKSTGLQLIISVSILLLIVWALGFISEPFLAGYIADIPSVETLLEGRQRGGWLEHFLRGGASLGLIGFMKVIYLIGPGSWWNLRQSGVLGGRDRVARIGWIVIAVGVANFFLWLWRKVGALVERRMEQVAWDVLEVGENGRERISVSKEIWEGTKKGYHAVRTAMANAMQSTEAPHGIR